MSIKTSSIYTSGNNAYFYSDRVKVFPCAYRNNKYDATARLNTEYNFTHLPHMIDKASYIIEFTEEKLICVIQGYYFEIELGDGNFATLNYNEETKKYKYLNICVASPNGAGSIESPHLCSWDGLSGIEGTLDIEQIGGTFFAGLKIGDGVLSNGGGYQCYALKLDDSAKLPIMANKIENIIKNKEGVENGTGKPINQEFTTETLSATTSISTPELKVASNKLIAKSDGITASTQVTINSTLEVKDSTATTSILKAENDQVVINKPTNITGATEIKGANGNLTVAGTGNFGDKLTVSKGGADITGATILKGTVDITGKTTIGTDSATEIENDTIKTSKITIEKALGTGSLVIDKTKNNIIEIKNSSDEFIFSVDTKSGETYAKKIKAPVEGISADAENVNTSINGKSITDIFETNGLVVQKASSLTATSSTDSAGNIIITGNTTGTVDALIPAKTEGRTYNIGSSNETFDNIYATTFHGSLAGNANTATAFKEAASITLTGDVITSTAATGTHGWTVNTIIQNNAVTTSKIANSAVTNAKLENNAVTTDKIFDWNVTTAKIADSAVTGGKIAENAVTTSKIANSAVTEAKLHTDAVTTSKIKDGNVTNDKLVYNSITIGSTEVGLGGVVGDHESRRIGGTLYGISLNLSGDMVVNNIGNIKVNNAGLKSSSSLKVVGSTVKICDSALVVASDSVKIGTKLTITPSSGSIVSDSTITAASFNAKSDRRLKENIIDYKPEKSILDLPIKKFDFIDGPKNQIGCIAQDLKEICPEIVNENEKGYLSIQESKLVYLLLDEVKKLKKEVEELKSK